MAVHHDASDADSGRAHVVLHLTLSNLDPITGLIAVNGQHPAIPFTGWMDLMAAINTLSATSTG
jgi:hypothetical protein